MRKILFTVLAFASVQQVFATPRAGGIGRSKIINLEKETCDLSPSDEDRLILEAEKIAKIDGDKNCNSEFPGSSLRVIQTKSVVKKCILTEVIEGHYPVYNQAFIETNIAGICG